MSDLLTFAREDIADITGGDDVGTEITFRPLPSSTPVIVKGIACKHHLAIDGEGLRVNAKNAHVSVSESLLIAEGYTVRVNNEVAMKGHLINYKDSTGLEKDHKIEQVHADETLGFIYFMLGDYE